MTYYIVATAKGNPNTVEEIQGYQVNSTKTSGGRYYSKSEFFRDHFKTYNSYESYNANTGKGAECERRISSKGEYFLQTTGNGTYSDNLLNLPNVQIN